MEAGVTCVLAGEREVGGPFAAAFTAGCRFAVDFVVALGAGFGFGRSALAGALLFGVLLVGALLFGGALAVSFALAGLPRFFGAVAACSARSASD